MKMDPRSARSARRHRTAKRSVQCIEPDGLRQEEATTHPLSADNGSDFHADLAAEVTSAVDEITLRMAEKVRSEEALKPQERAELVASILQCRHDLHCAANAIVSTSAVQRKERIERVRKTLEVRHLAAAAFLLKIVDEPGRIHCIGSGYPPSAGDRRLAAVYVSDLRAKLRPHGLDTALKTVRSHGYRVSSADAGRIRALWEE